MRQVDRFDHRFALFCATHESSEPRIVYLHSVTQDHTTLRIDRPLRPWAGLRSFVSDGGVVGGFAPGSRGFFWVAALGGYGIQTGAALGEACAHLALGRGIPPHLADAGVSAATLGVERLQR